MCFDLFENLPFFASAIAPVLSSNTLIEESSFILKSFKIPLTGSTS